MAGSFSPDGRWLTTVVGRTVRVYDVRSGAETRSFRLSADCICVRYSPDGTRVAALCSRGIHLRDAAPHAWKPSWSSRGIYVWNAVSFQPHTTTWRVPAKTDQVEFGGCNHVLVSAARNDSVIRVWDVGFGEETRQLDTGPGTQWLRLGDGCGRVALTGSRDGTLRVWDVTTGQERTRLPTPQRFRFGVVNSDATKLATSSKGAKSVEIWSLAGGPGQQPAPDAAVPDDWCHRCTLMI